MSMNPVSRKLTDDEQRLVNEYLNNGGTITKAVSGRRSEDIEFKGGFYARKNKKKEEDV